MKKCKQGYYYCYKDKKCKKIPLGYRIGLGGWLRKEKEEETEQAYVLRFTVSFAKMPVAFLGKLYPSRP